MIKFEINVAAADVMFAALEASLTDMTPVMNTLGEMMVRSNQEGMLAGKSPDGSTFAPRSAVTLARYKKQGKSFGLPLQVTSGLRNSIFPQASATEVTWGTNLIQSAVMHFGAVAGAFGTMSNGSSIPWGNIPARPFIGASAEDEVNIIATLEEWLSGAVDQTP